MSWRTRPDRSRQRGYSSHVERGTVSKLTFRSAGAADVIRIVELVESAYRGERSRQGWTTEADLLDGQRTDDAEISAIVDSDDGRMLLAETSGELVGCCQLEARPDGCVYLGMFAVAPNCQSRGIGHAILAEAERIAYDDLGSNGIRMMVIRQREDVIGWYERLGYEQTGRVVAFPYGDERKGIPRRADLEFLVLDKARPGCDS